MKVPNTTKKKALLVIDVQPAFIRPHNRYIIPNIVSLIKQVPYDLYVEAVFYGEAGSLWDQQQKWTAPMGPDTHTVDEISDALSSHNPIKVLKETRSVFKGTPDIRQSLEANGIEELHVVGTETNDCVFATVLDAFDNGYLAYILEECCQSGTADRHEPAVRLLEYQGMTNNHCLAKTMDINI